MAELQTGKYVRTDGGYLWHIPSQETTESRTLCGADWTFGPVGRDNAASYVQIAVMDGYCNRCADRARRLGYPSN